MTSADVTSRYQLRVLGPEHKAWAKALRIYSLIFNSPGWRAMYPDNLVARTYKGYDALDGLITHCIASGWTYGVFDTQYKPQHGGDGQLLWDFNNLEATEEELLQQMDFPLVSIALSYDGYDPPLVNPQGLTLVIPAITEQNKILNKLDVRDPADWKPTGLRQVLMRNGTSTSPSYSGKGLMGRLARHLVDEARAAGFHAMQMRASSAAVLHVWENLPSPCRCEVISELTEDLGAAAEPGKTLTSTSEARNFRIARLWITLN